MSLGSYHHACVTGPVIVCDQECEGDRACDECWKPEPLCWVGGAGLVGWQGVGLVGELVVEQKHDLPNRCVYVANTTIL